MSDSYVQKLIEKPDKWESWQDVMEFCLNMMEPGDSSFPFVCSLYTHYDKKGKLTERQIECLKEIWHDQVSEFNSLKDLEEYRRKQDDEEMLRKQRQERFAKCPTVGGVQ